MTIHDRINEMTELAKTYAEDGAFRTAAHRLRKLADELDAHAAETEPRDFPKRETSEPIRKRIVNTSSRDKLLKRYRKTER